MSKFIGIDLGTTNSVMSYVDTNGEVKLIPNKEGGYITPSAVTVTPNNEIIVGSVAKHFSTRDENTVLSIKRKMGTDYKVDLGGKKFSPVDISAMILKKLKNDAETFFGEEVKDAVITVPAYFTDSQRTATRDAGTIAGFNVLTIINEPTSASLAYGLREDQEGNVIVYDLGGGTFDVSIVSISDGIFEVIATGGDNNLGGDDFDHLLADYLADWIKNVYSDFEPTPLIMRQLYAEAEKLKITLSTEYLTQVNFKLEYVEGKVADVNFELTRQTYKDLIEPLIDKTFVILKTVLSEARLTMDDIDDFILVGGSTKSPIIHEYIKELGIRPRLYQPDLCVAMGAAIQAGIILGEHNTDLLLLDVTSMDMGIEIRDGIFSPIIPRNNKIPCRETQVFTNQYDNQEYIFINIYQGLMPLVSGNTKLGSFKLGPISPVPAGKAVVEVTFELDHNGILKVKAMDILGGTSMEVEIQSLSLTSEELEAKLEESKQFIEANPDVLQEYISSNEVKNAKSVEEYYEQEKQKYLDNIKRVEEVEKKLEKLSNPKTAEEKEERLRLETEKAELDSLILLYQISNK